MNTDISQANNHIELLEQRIQQLESQLSAQALVQPGTRSILLSSNFFKRAFAIWGYYFVAQIMLATVVTGVLLLISLFLP